MISDSERRKNEPLCLLIDNWFACSQGFVSWGGLYLCSFPLLILLICSAPIPSARYLHTKVSGQDKIWLNILSFPKLESELVHHTISMHKCYFFGPTQVIILLSIYLSIYLYVYAGKNQLSSVSVVIEVLDVNDNVPTLSRDYQPYVCEGTQTGEVC